MKFIQLSVMHWIKLSLSLCKALQVRRKCNSSSTSLLEHLGHVLLCRGIPWCLPFPIFRECADKRSLVKCFLISILFTTYNYLVNISATSSFLFTRKKYKFTMSWYKYIYIYIVTRMHSFPFIFLWLIYQNVINSLRIMKLITQIIRDIADFKSGL